MMIVEFVFCATILRVTYFEFNHSYVDAHKAKSPLKHSTTNRALTVLAGAAGDERSLTLQLEWGLCHRSGSKVSDGISEGVSGCVRAQLEIPSNTHG